jgi:hypothetical protein
MLRSVQYGERHDAELDHASRNDHNHDDYYNDQCTVSGNGFFGVILCPR